MKGFGVDGSDQSLVTPLVRGAISALVCLGAALAVVVVPALAVQLSAGGSSLSALEAIVLGLNILILGHGGSLELTTGVVDGAVSLTPLGLTALFVLINALGARHAASLLDPIEDDGGLRPHALRDLGAALAAHTVLYATALSVLGALGRSPDIRAVIVSAVASGAFVAMLGGGLGILWALRRDVREIDESVRVLDLLPAPYGALARGTGIALLSLVGLGFAMVALMTVLGIREAASLQDSLQAGVVGGLVLTLLQIALLPLFAVWALAVLLGGTVTLGTGTAFSLGGIDTGVMPALPWLATLPEPGTPRAAFWLLLLLPALGLGLGAVVVIRDAADLARREQILAWVLYPVAVTVGVLLVVGLATGGIGAGRLQHLGPQMGTLLLPLVLSAVITTGLALVMMASPLPAMVRSTVAGVREKVESEEAEEKAEREGTDLAAARRRARLAQASRPATGAQTAAGTQATTESGRAIGDTTTAHEDRTGPEGSEPDTDVRASEESDADERVDEESAASTGDAEPAEGSDRD